MIIHSLKKFKMGFTIGQKKFNKSVMMWLCIASDGSSKLIRCDNRQDSASYQTTVLTPALSFISHRTSVDRLRGPPIVFQQDGASSHRSASTLRFLRQRRVSLLPDWPANSPDCNPVEHCWAWIARRLVGKSFGTEDELEAAIRQEWDLKPPTLIPNLVGSMVRRLTSIVVARGAATRY